MKMDYCYRLFLCERRKKKKKEKKKRYEQSVAEMGKSSNKADSYNARFLLMWIIRLFH